MTYEITEDHERLIENVVAKTDSSSYALLSPDSVSFEELAEDGLNDATDDSDFVLSDSADGVLGPDDVPRDGWQHADGLLAQQSRRN